MYKTILQKTVHGLESNYFMHKLSLWPVVFVKILPARGTRQSKFEFGNPPNQELNKIIRFKERRIKNS